MHAFRRALIVTSALYGAPATAQPLVAHFEDVHDWHVTAAQSADVARVAAGFSAFGRQFDMELEANPAVVREFTTVARAYRGRLRGADRSWVRIVVSPDGPAGIIWDGVTLYGIEAGGAGMLPAIFRADDVIVPPGTMTCGMHEPADTAAAMFAELALERPPTARATGATLNLDLGVVSDPQFGALHADAGTAMLVRMNNIDGIFSEQLGLQISVEHVDVFADELSDPFTNTGNAETLLDELAVYRGNTPAQDQQGLTHFFTGRDLDGSTVGLAFLGSVCSQSSQFDPDGRSYGVALTQANGAAAGELIESLIAAHEIGHNFGAPHDGEAGECVDAPPGHLMAPSLSPLANEFSQCSIDVISASFPSLDCLSVIPAVDLAIEAQAGAPALTQAPIDYVIEIRNEGLEAAADATVELTFGPGLEVLSVTPQSGTCGPPQASVVCQLGAVSGSGLSTIDVAVRSEDPGNRTIEGSVAATDDVNADNDRFTAAFDVQPATDLALVTGPWTLPPDESSSVSATLENRSGIDAGGAVVTGTWSAGLQVDAVTLGGVACTTVPAARSFDCAPADLPAYSSTAIDIVVTGVEPGSRSFTLAVDAQLADPDTANNTATIAFQVTGDTSTDDDSGGGSLGPAALLALFGGLLRRRRYHHLRKANFS